MDNDLRAKKNIEQLILVYDRFVLSRQCSSIFLDTSNITLAVTDAMTDIKRASDYHSETGADALRRLSYIAKWVVHHKPICIKEKFELTENNINNSISSKVNARYVIFFIDYYTREIEGELSKEFYQDLFYVFQFRSHIDAESLYLSLKHGLR